jgi:hypothetical protein
MHTKFWSENLKGIRSLVSLSLRYDNIKIDIKDLWCKVIERTLLAQGPVLDFSEHGN